MKQIATTKALFGEMLIFHIKKKNRKYELLEINLAFL